jgi:hypothetical protein
VLADEVWTYEWTNVTRILHLCINLWVKCVFNAQYQCIKHMNYEWMNFARFPLLNCEMLNLWCISSSKEQKTFKNIEPNSNNAPILYFYGNLQHPHKTSTNWSQMIIQLIHVKISTNISLDHFWKQTYPNKFDTRNWKYWNFL